MLEKRRPTEQEKQHRVFCANWINKIASAMTVELSEATVAIYLERMLPLTPEQIEKAGNRVIDEWREPHKMPPWAFFKERIGVNAQLLAEQEWEMAWKLVKRDWYADGIGWVNDAQKKLTPAMCYAIRQCGGEPKMAYASEKDFPFLRKTFLEAHERFSVEGGEQTRLTHGEAKQLLDALRKQLPEKSK